MSAVDFSQATFSPLPMTGEQLFTPAQLQEGWVVLYFYPRDATPACTTEGLDFNAAVEAFSALGVKIYGVSRDTLASHQRFKEKQDFAFDLVSDTEEVLCQLFGVIKEKMMYGRKVMGIERSTFILHNGMVQKAWRKVKVKTHVAEVLEAIKALQAE
ncbi:peroxiredoxin [Suttonella ornithocola]|uniref:thioredoxin-dependent peroxiredoxin n=1 Tax=Suttonella ornithocola TaxID=279832 RepID=A0A380MPP2_9GAMM|nr:peroxiredoxin [Suttonella ornithocola]SUO94589.1 Putative peroxiredoxin bcp [Suttonella ornithocola]